MEQNRDSSDPEVTENARAGYAGAITLWTQEGAQIWAKFSAMVYAHTVVILTIGVLLNVGEREDFRLFRVMLCLLGLLLCQCWHLITRRSFQYMEYYIRSARELEEQYLGCPVRVVSRGARLFEGAVCFEGQEPLEVEPGWRNQSVRRMIYFAIVLFVLLYLVAILYEIPLAAIARLMGWI